MEALKCLFSERIEKENPKPGEHDDDTKLGQKYRAYIQAKQLLNKILDDLGTYDMLVPENSEFNKEV